MAVAVSDGLRKQQALLGQDRGDGLKDGVEVGELAVLGLRGLADGPDGAVEGQQGQLQGFRVGGVLLRSSSGGTHGKGSVSP